MGRKEGGFLFVIIALYQINTSVSFLESYHFEDSCSNLDDFSCGEGKCIPKEKRCDGKNDCPDNRDELNCGNNFCDKFEQEFKLI